MGFQRVASLEADITYALGKKDKTTGKTAPKQVEGYYLGCRAVNGGKFGESNLHVFQTATGNIGVWGGTDMDRKLSQVASGVMTRVTAAGQKPTPKGDMNVFDVEQDPENVIAGITQSAVKSAKAITSYDDEDDVDEEDYEDGPEDEQVARPTLTAAQRQAKVNELLGGKGNKKN